MAEARRWLELPGLTVDVVCAELRRITAAKTDGPPSSFKYFTPAMQRLSGALSAPLLAPVDRPQARGSSPPPPLDLAELVRKREAELEAKRVEAK